MAMNLSGPLPSLDTLEASIWLEYLLLGDLRQLLAEPSGGIRRTWLAALVDAFIDNLSRLAHLRNAGGDVSEVVHELPHWHRGIGIFMDASSPERLRLEELRARLELGLPFEPAGRRVRDDLSHWMAALRAPRPCDAAGPPHTPGAGD
jgi:hypothetical protein